MSRPEFNIWCPPGEGPKRALREIRDGVNLPAKLYVERVRKLPDPSPGDVTLVMGGRLFEQLHEAAGLPKKQKTLTSNRERIIDWAGAKFLVTYDPTMIYREAEKRVDLAWDLQLIARFAAYGSLKPVVGEYRWVPDFCDAYIAWREARKAGVPFRVVADLETMGLDPFAPGKRILTVALTYEDKKADVFKVPEDGKLPPAVLSQLRCILCKGTSRVEGANLNYDKLWMSVHWGLTGIRHYFDSYLAGSLLDENRSNSLETHAKVYTTMGGYDLEFNQKYDKAQMELVPDADMLQYTGGDTDAARRVCRVQRRLLTQDRKLARFYARILQPASEVFLDIQKRGVCLDVKKFDELEVKAKEEIEALKAQCFSFFPRRFILRHAKKLDLRAAVVKEFMFTRRGLNLDVRMLTPKGEELSEDGDDVDPYEFASTAKDHLKQFIDDERAAPFVETLLKLRAVEKTLSTYIIGFRKHIRADGRFHPTYRLGRGSSRSDATGGTVTGRTSATEPAYQTIPKRTAWAKPLRMVYIPPPGHGILKLDYSQGELRIMAVLAREPTMLHAYQQGIDLHALTAANTMSLSLSKFMSLEEAVIEAKRTAAKAINFGLLYGMQALGLKDYSYSNYGVKMSVQEAGHNRDVFFQTYKRLEPYHEEQKAIAHRRGFIRNPLGRVRHLPLINSPDRDIRSTAERQAINSRIQSCLSDMMQLAMVLIKRRWPDLWIFGMTHDSLEIYVPLDRIMDMARRIQDVMQNLPLADFDWEPPIQFVVDAEVATEGSLADVKKVKFDAVKEAA